jgi:hypothetical protein
MTRRPSAAEFAPLPMIETELRQAIAVQPSALDQWDDLLRHLIDPVSPQFERNIIRRQIAAATAASDLGLRVSPDQVRKRLLALQRGRLHGSEDRGTAGGQKVKITEKRYLISGLIAHGVLTGIAAFNKVGKTKLACEVLRSLVFQQPFMGNPEWMPAPGPHKFLLWWVDQPAADSAEYLKAVGLMEPDGTLHPSIIRLYTEEDDLAWDDHGMDVLLDHVEREPGLVLFTDSFFHSIQRLYGSDQEPEAGGALIDVQTLLAPAQITHLVLFHSPKETGPVGINAIRGHGSAGGAVSGVISLHFMERKCPTGSGRWVADKENPHRRMVFEGRGPFLDRLVRLDAAQGRWSHLGEFSQAVANLTADDRAADSLAGLTEQQRETLEVIGAAAGIWKNPKGVSAREVAVCIVNDGRPGSPGAVQPTSSEVEMQRKRLQALQRKGLVRSNRDGRTERFTPRLPY